MNFAPFALALLHELTSGHMVKEHQKFIQSKSMSFENAKHENEPSSGFM
jgi:hypothetical protein